MYLRRYIDEWLYNWKNRKDKNPALIVGIRQCGKTKSIEHFAEKEYKNMIKINFWDDKECCSDFDESLEVDKLISNISLRFPNQKIEPHNTLIFFDEIQECPRARLAFKNFSIDGRYDVIGSGSYLGINGYVINDSTPLPIGYEDVFHMNTMSFEEFLWAKDYTDEHIKILENHFINRVPVDRTTHTIFKNLFNQYVCIGGFPKVVLTYVETKNLMECVRKIQDIIFDMKRDFGRRVNKNGEPIFKPTEVARIQNVFDLIPAFLAKENKRFIVSKIQTGKSVEKVDAIEFLKQAHIIEKVYNLENVSLPLNGNVINSQFKIFPTDIGVLSSMYGINTIIAINKGELGQAGGAVYEAVVLDSLYKAGIESFYFAKESGLEIDFVICYDGYSYLVESKVKNGNTKSSKTVMANKDHYGPTKLLKIGDYNVGEIGDVLTIPHYMTFLLGRKKELIVEDLSYKD